MRGGYAVDRYNPDSVHKRVDYVQYIYKNSMHPNNFENLSFPIAAYDHAGKITGANSMFREIAGITEDDIEIEKANIFDCLNDKNAVLIEAAHNAFDGEEKVYENISPALHTKGDIAGYKISLFPNAIFFPMTLDRAGVKLAGILLDKNKADDDSGGTV